MRPVAPESIEPDQGPGTIARLSGLDLDDLIEELRSRAGSARKAQERLGALLDAVVAVTSDLELAAVLRRIVESACQLVDATYGALGVLRPNGEELIEFVTHGISDEDRAAIGPLPHGRGLLGMIITRAITQAVPANSSNPTPTGRCQCRTPSPMATGPDPASQAMPTRATAMEKFQGT